MTTQCENAVDVTIREASLADANRCGEIFYSVFEAIAHQHKFPVEPGSPEFTNYKMGELLESDGIFGIVAEREGTVVGSAFVDERGRGRGNWTRHGRPRLPERRRGQSNDAITAAT